MTNMLHTISAQDGLRLKTYLGDSVILLAFDLDEHLTQNLAGFAIKCTPPNDKSFYLLNRLDFTTPVTSKTTPEQRTWHPSDQAPFQKFRWVDFPSDPTAGTYHYEVTAMYFKGGGLKPGPSTTTSFELESDQTGNFEFGFTRGYLSSQAYADRFHNAPIRPAPKSIDYDTRPFANQYEWLGFHARKLLFGFMQECLDDPNITVDLFAYDLDEPDFIQGLQKLGGRLRAVLDNAPLHTKRGAMEVLARAALEKSAGAQNIKVGHFKRFAHDKVMIQKKDGKPVKVLTGSANFSVRGLYVQANNVLVYDDASTAELYEQAFNESFNDMVGFQNSAIAKQWFDIKEPALPSFSVAFSPHKTAAVSLGKVSDAIKKAKSSVLYAVMELGGGGPVLKQLQGLGSRKNIFSYGVSQSDKGLKLYKPGETHGVFASFAYLAGKVPDPFRAEYSGGMGQVIHDKFVVVDFDVNPVVFTGSSNLAEGGEQSNGDNLLAIYDPTVATAYAVEAIRLIDHYHFRMAMKGATKANPLQLQTGEAKTKWWEPYYDKKNIKFYERLLFSR